MRRHDARGHGGRGLGRHHGGGEACDSATVPRRLPVTSSTRCARAMSPATSFSTRKNRKLARQVQPQRQHVAAAPAVQVLARQPARARQQQPQRAPQRALQRHVVADELVQELAQRGRMQRRLLPAFGAELQRRLGAAVAAGEVGAGGWVRHARKLNAGAASLRPLRLLAAVVEAREDRQVDDLALGGPQHQAVLLALEALAGVGEVVGELEVVDVGLLGQARQVGQVAADDGDAVDGDVGRPGGDGLELGVGARPRTRARSRRPGRTRSRPRRRRRRWTSPPSRACRPRRARCSRLMPSTKGAIPK